MRHLKTPVLLGLTVLFFLGLVRWGVPFFFAEAGPAPLRTVLGVGGHSNVPQDTAEWATKPVQYVGAQACSQCHGERVTQWSQGSHATVSCENCHGPARDHIGQGASPVVNTSPALCARCHSKVLGRPTSFPQVVLEEHAGGLLCISCHNPHSPGFGPTVPTEGESSLPTPTPAGNGAEQKETPTDATPEAGGQEPEGSPIPAPSPSPSPAPSPTLTPVAPPTPTPTPATGAAPQVPHSVKGRSDCLACHGPGRLKPFPDNHAGRQSDVCLACHRTK